MDEPITLVIFGASGDLARRKLLPALFNLYRKRRLPASCRIVGFARTPMRDDEFRAAMRAAVGQFAGFAFTEAEWAEFAPRLSYLAGGFTQPADFERLAAALAAREGGPSHRLYYLATPPGLAADIVAGLHGAGLAAEAGGWRRVVVEKPFGSDLPSARDLNRRLHEVLDERQIYRIDHYLGKETVQNLLVFRFANALFESVWSREHVDHVQITVAEEVGAEHRAGYYDGVGVLGDMFQNHLLQLLALVAMEPPAPSTGDAVREEKVRVLKAIRPIRPEEAGAHSVRGQYRGYRGEPGVNPDSQTATYAALRLFVDNPRWQGVPFFLRSGKRLAEKSTEILIQFKPPRATASLPAGAAVTPNLLAMCLQPDEGIHLRFEVKVPDMPSETRSLDMEFHYRDAFGPLAIPEAYERLLLDALHGDATLFTRADRAELAWALIDPILAGWQSPAAPPLHIYEPGSWGPVAADEFLARGGRRWVKGCGGHGHLKKR